MKGARGAPGIPGRGLQGVKGERGDPGPPGEVQLVDGEVIVPGPKGQKVSTSHNRLSVLLRLYV